jgi:AcrR family transcriptional regulator
MPSAMPTSRAASKRDLLIDTATRLFTRNGFRTTGIAEILAESGIAKGTLYQHFESKDALIEAVLRRMGDRFRIHFVEAVERAADTPRERLLALFDVYGHMTWARDGYCGCPFTRVAGEFADRGHPVHRVAALTKRLMTAYIRDLAAQAGAADPDALACHLTLLLEGASVLHSMDEPGACRDLTARAREAAGTLVAAAVGAAAR